jgi:hypothetical protein
VVELRLVARDAALRELAVRAGVGERHLELESEGELTSRRC